MKNKQLLGSINGKPLTKRKIKASIPQGLVLGSKFLNIYLNDTPRFSKTHSVLFANDTAIYASAYNAIITVKLIQTHTSILDQFLSKIENIIKFKYNRNHRIPQKKEMTIVKSFNI